MQEPEILLAQFGRLLVLIHRGGGKAKGRRAKRVKRMGVGPHAH
jgi:hypothetical protein